MNCLIFDYNYNIGNTLRRRLEAKVWLVLPGKRLERIDDTTFTIDPGRYNDYQELLKMISVESSGPPRYILHTWSRCIGDFKAGGVEDDLAMGFYSIFHLTRAIMPFCHQLSPEDRFRLVYCYSVNQENHLPTFAAVAGFARSVKMEQPQIIIKVAGLRAPEVTASCLPEAAVLELVRREWDVAGDEEIEVFYSDGQRHVKRLKSLPKPPAPSGRGPFLRIRDKGIYLLTGGFGSLGIIFARYLAAQGNVHLVLAGRSPVNREGEQIMAELGETGARVTALQADFTNPLEVERLISSIKAMDGRLRGIIHSAGITRDGLVLTKTLDEVAGVLAPKVHGTLALDQATCDLDLDFFVLFSSLAAVLGNVGQCDYAYANSFMDVFAQWREEKRRQGLRHGRCVSINWPYWREGRMQPNKQARDWLRKLLGIEALNTGNGLRALEDALASGVSQMVVLEGKGQRLRSKLLQGKKDHSEDARNAPMKASLSEASVCIQTRLIQLISRELKVKPERIRSNEPLENYGMDSNAVVRLNHALEKEYGELSKTLFYEFRTIEELAGYLQERNARKVSAGYTPVEVMPLPDPEKAPAGPFQASIPLKAESGEAIAIIGISGRYPMADNLDQLWENLRVGRDCISEIPGKRWDHSRYFDPEHRRQGTSYAKWGGFLSDIDAFDPLFFNIPPREAHAIDPQERLFLESAWHAIESAGYTRAALSAHQVGVFAGVMWSQYQLIGVEAIGQGVVPPAGSIASIANRVSYFLDLQGPSLGVDTMCSSSLSAIHLACRALRDGECEMALAGGVNLIVHPARYLQLSREKFLSTDGRCRSFGADGDGYVPGEGVGVVLLKPLKTAVDDRDRILAVIKSSALNHGGKTNGYRVPNPIAQSQLIGEAMKNARVAPHTISYIEAHGTGTALGDPIEINGLQRAFRIDQDEDRNGTPPVAIGTLKSNIGHLEGAAGIAGLTKIVLQMQHNQLVPSLHCEQLNPNIDFDRCGFYVQQQLGEWPSRPGRLRRAGLSSFGAGGANGHFIIEEPPRRDKHRGEPLPGPHLLVLSARTEERLRAAAAQLHHFIATKGKLAAPQVSASRLNKIMALVAEVLGVVPEDLVADEPLMEYGFNALDLQALIEALRQNVALDLQPNQITIQQSVSDIVAVLHEHEANDTVADPYFIEDLAYTLQVGREPMAWRLALIVRDTEDALARLFDMIEGAAPDDEYLWLAKCDGEETSRSASKALQALSGLRFPMDAGSCRQLAGCWVSGAAIAWAQFYQDPQPYRIEAPVYPFARDRYWFEPEKLLSGEIASRPASHPLLKGPDMVASLEQGLVFSTVLTPELPLFSEHSLGPLPVFPGAGYLEMALAAANRVDPGNHFLVNRFTLIQPLFARGQAVTLRLRLWRESDSWSWQAESGDRDNPVVHAGGRLQQLATGTAQPDNSYPDLDLKSIRAKCPHELEAETFYRRLGDNGIGYNAYYRCLQQICSGANQALAHYLLPEVCHREFSKYHVHPVLLDGAFQALASLASAFGNGSRPLQMPFCAERVELRRRPPRQGHVWVEVDDKANTCHLVLADEKGRVCLNVSGLVLRPMPDFNEVAAAGSAKSAPSFGFAQVRQSMALPVPDPSALSRFRSGFNEVEHLSAQLMLAALRELGVFLKTGEQYDSAGLPARLGISDSKQRLFEAFLHVITNQDWIARDKGQVIATPKLFQAELPETIAELASLKQTLCDKWPELAAHFELVWVCGRRFPEVLKGHVSATEILFPQASMALVEPIYRGNPFADYYNQQVAAAVLALVTARQSAGAAVSILEVGAGTGGTSIPLLAALAPYGERLRYTYTDISAAFVQYGRQKLAADYPFAEFRMLDISRNVFEQGFCSGDYDIVLAANVLHATSDISRTLRQVRRLLRPRGLLLLNEMVGFQAFTTATFGLLDGWWAYRDEAQRLAHAPLLSYEMWRAQLNGHGFDQVDPAPDPACEEQAVQMVILAGADAQRVVPPKQAPTTHPVSEPLPVDGGSVAAGADRGSIEERVTTAVAATLGQVLELQQQDFDPKLPFIDYGVDSVLAVEFINRLNQDLGIDLRSTDIFSYPSPKGLIEYISSHFAAELAGTDPKDQADNRGAPVVVSKAAAAERGDVAVIGMSGAFPSGDDLSMFWDLLKKGGEGISEIPATRWVAEDWYDPDPNAPRKSISKWGGFLNEADTFDPRFFNLSPREAEFIDPKQRKFMEHAYAALEDAGYADTAVNNSRCGVYVGCRSSDYMINLKDHDMEDNAYAFIGNSESILAARIAYQLNLKGPAIAIDTACSSSLVAIHLAYESLVHGTCDMALAGGVSIIGRPDTHILLSKTGMLSATGRCRTFDRNADGIVPSEGVGVVLLKPLAAALADRDPIHGIIKGTGINQDGTSKGLTAPSGLSQTALIREVYERYNIDPETIGLVEAHGTGTKLGDPIEVHALTDAFACFTKKKQFCPIGSVKSNIGHALAAAGMTSLFKVLLCLKHRYLAPSRNLDQENEHINFVRTPFVPILEGRPWDTRPGIARRGVVSSFGFSGTNAHMVVEEAPTSAITAKDRPAYLFALSARDRAALLRKLSDLRDWLSRHNGQSHPGDVAATLHLGRNHFEIRCVILASTLDELSQELERLCNAPETQEIVNQKDYAPSQSTDSQEGDVLINELFSLERDAVRYRERLAVIAEFYKQGRDLPWARLYEGFRRLHMPTYPFDKKRFWINSRLAQATADDQDRTSSDTAEPGPLSLPGKVVKMEKKDEDQLQDIFVYRPVWHYAPLSQNGDRAPGPCLVFSDDASWRTALEGGRDIHDVMIVHRGAGYERPAAGTQIIDPADPGHYLRLFRELQAENRLPRHILCLWAMEGADTFDGDTLTIGVVHHLMQALCNVGHQQVCALLFAYDLSRREWVPMAEAVSTLGRSLQSLLPRLSLACIGLNGSAMAPGFAARHLALELAALEHPGAAAEIRYKGQNRYIAVNQALEIPPLDGTSPISGTVLITGGSGGLGVGFARRLLSQGVKVVLLGRSPNGEERVRRALADTSDSLASSDNWIYLASEVTDENRLSKALNTARQRFGPITGIIHAAGLRDEILFTDKPYSRFRKNMAPKIEGSQILDQLTRNDPLEFFILFSSTAAILGDHGQGDYALANRFIESFAVQRARLRASGERRGHTMAISWPLWRNSGMKLSNNVAKQFYVEAMGLQFLSENTGWSIFQRLLKTGHTRIIPLVGDKTKIEGLLSIASLSPPAQKRSA